MVTISEIGFLQETARVGFRVVVVGEAARERVGLGRVLLKRR